MSNDELERQAQIEIAFCASNPELTRLPHCLFRNRGEPARIIADMVGLPVGVWGDWPFVDANGEPYLEPEDGRIIEDFPLWSLDPNQEQARRFHGKSGCFTMVIPAATSFDVLRRTYELRKEDDQVFAYETYINRIAALIPEIGWAYIPLEYEFDCAMFVTSHGNRHLVGELGKRLEQAGISPVFDVSITESGQRWNGPLFWESDEKTREWLNSVYHGRVKSSPD